MVLALTTTAHAALSLSLSATTVGVGDTVTCSVSSNNTNNWTMQFILSEDTYNWTDPVAADYYPDRANAVNILPAAGDMADVAPNPTYPALIALTAAGTSPPSPGVQFEITIRGVQPGAIYLFLHYTSEVRPITPPESLTLVVVPEPMTITLLALGGLFLRRRRKI